jgi:hypothetical protein
MCVLLNDSPRRQQKKVDLDVVTNVRDENFIFQSLKVPSFIIQPPLNLPCIILKSKVIKSRNFLVHLEARYFHIRRKEE